MTFTCRTIRRIIQAALLCVALAITAASCRRTFDLPLQEGSYYSVQLDGNQYFAMVDSCDGQSVAHGHYYAAGDGFSAPRTTFSAVARKRNIEVSSEEGTVRFKKSDASYALYKEPPYSRKDDNLYLNGFCDVSVTPDVVYGNAQGYWTSLEGAEEDIFKIFSQGYVKSFKKKSLDLKMDIYRPEGLSGKRPLILFIHGGAFYIGYKDEPAYVDFCKHFSSMGYVTASIDYRLGFHASKNEIERAGYVALQDAHAAMRYLVAHSDEYGIDTSRIFVAGSSAGAITALNLAFMRDDNRPDSSRGKKAFLSNKADLGAIDSSGNKLKARFDILALANMWGAVSDLEMLGNGRTSIVSFHGEADKVVPYAEGYPLAVAGESIARMLSEEMYGSSCIDSKAAEAGLRHRFYSFPGEGHAFNTSGKNKQPNGNHTIIKERIKDFFFDEMVPQRASIVDDDHGNYHIAGSNISDVQWKIQGGFVLTTPEEDSIRILWCEDKAPELAASGTYGNDISWNASILPVLSLE